MQGVVPGQNLRKSKFDLVKKDVKIVHDQLKAHQTPDEKTIDQYLHYLGKSAKDVELYAKEVPGAKPFHDNYVWAVAGLKQLKEQLKRGGALAAGGVPKIIGQLEKMTNANYAKAPNEA
jgi:hypothetical protein